jgi:hypothetical protein
VPKVTRKVKKKQKKVNIFIKSSSLGGTQDFKGGLNTSGLVVNPQLEGINLEFTDSLSEVETLTTLAFLYIKNGMVLKRVELKNCICTVSSPKKIVTIEMLGRGNDLYEYQGNGNYEIEVVATVVQDVFSTLDGEEYPLEKFRELIKLLDAGEALHVQSDFLEVYGIKTVVVFSHNASQNTWTNNQPLSISMKSDYPYEIKLKLDAKN